MFKLIKKISALIILLGIISFSYGTYGYIYGKKLVQVGENLQEAEYEYENTLEEKLNDAFVTRKEHETMSKKYNFEPYMFIYKWCYMNVYTEKSKDLFLKQEAYNKECASQKIDPNNIRPEIEKIYTELFNYKRLNGGEYQKIESQYFMLNTRELNHEMLIILWIVGVVGILFGMVSYMIFVNMEIKQAKSIVIQ